MSSVKQLNNRNEPADFNAAVKRITELEDQLLQQQDDARNRMRAILNLQQCRSLLREAAQECDSWNSYQMGRVAKFMRHWAAGRDGAAQRRADDCRLTGDAANGLCLSIIKDAGRTPIELRLAAFEKDVEVLMRDNIADGVYAGRLSGIALQHAHDARDLIDPPQGEVEELKRRVERLER